MSRFKWGKNAVHMADKELLEMNSRSSICWVKTKGFPVLTTDQKRVTCKFCLKIMEDEKDVDES